MPPSVPATLWENILGRSGRNENLQRQDVDSICHSIERLKAGGLSATIVCGLCGDRTLSVNFGPMEGDGWLITLEDISDRRQAEARISHMAHHDALTGLPNQVLFQHRLSEGVARSRRGQPSAVLYLDLDHFKAVNDTLGQPSGDALLREVTVRMRRHIRDIDTVARLGGDEFAVVQSSLDQPEDALALAKRLIEVLGLPYDLDGHHVMVGTKYRHRRPTGRRGGSGPTPQECRHGTL